MIDATFSLVGRCPLHNDVGVATATARIAVGSRVPLAFAQVGATASQADTNPRLARQALAFLREGLSPDEALALALAADHGRDGRQAAVIDVNGRTACHTGRGVLENNPWAGSLTGRNCVALGNLLTGPEVLQAMARRFQASSGFLGERLLLALESGQQAGGDKRGKVSAALVVVRESEHPLLDLRVDMSEEPVADLRRLFDEHMRVFPVS